jgi:hypothetical protein
MAWEEAVEAAEEALPPQADRASAAADRPAAIKTLRREIFFMIKPLLLCIVKSESKIEIVYKVRM